MEKKIGMNKTGVAVSPMDAAALAKDVEALTRPSPGTAKEVAMNRIREMEESDPLGSIPPPAGVKGMVNTGMQFLKGNDPKGLIDKLAERLAFERSGVRLYDAIISKRQAEADLPAIFSLEVLQEFREEELDHFHLVWDCLKEIGADPTAQPPSADVIGVASMGLVKVATDPRIGFASALESILIAELADNDGWNLLIKLTREAGLDKFADRFEEAYGAEERHLQVIRDWVQRLHLSGEVPERKTA